eukprot:tig00000704_g3287.t1
MHPSPTRRVRRHRGSPWLFTPRSPCSSSGPRHPGLPAAFVTGPRELIVAASVLCFSSLFAVGGRALPAAFVSGPRELIVAASVLCFSSLFAVGWAPS